MVWRTANDEPYLLSSDKTNILTAAGIQFPGLSEQTGKATSKGIEFDLNGNIGKTGASCSIMHIQMLK